jgi:hypothetical protein
LRKSSTTRKRNEKEDRREQHRVNKADMNKNEDVHISVAVIIRILDAELEIGHVGFPRPVLSDDEPSEKEKIENGIGEGRSI